ncbi:hypothetical protein KDH_50380 [Dictyobacter sp. S3.2.2.5]|uniref:Transposase IS4-like domain-containing protein n=1 Tax=Dictyobacter halimunensis TaxID=3026934 RepID=A0ABQ6FVB3_9CHLR|nr:hypothetical protein KDH_50380 [Dictyobacter sp. S3.2.2.5]
MESIASLSQALRALFFEDAARLAKEQHVIKRQRCFSATNLLLVLVLGWLQHPLAGPSQLARFAHAVGVSVSKQAIVGRLSFQTASWLRRVLEQAVSTLILSSPLTQGLLARFPAVILEDASSVQLPDALAFLWKGCGGSGSASSVKLGVRWDLRSGQLRGPLLQDGKSHETHNPVHALALPVGGVWVADAAYYSLRSLRQLTQRGIFFVIRPRGDLAVSTPDGKRLPLARYLSQQTGKVIDLSVRLGSIPALWLPARLLALPVAPEVAEQRRAHLVEKAKNRGHTPSAEALALAPWNLLVTNIPAMLLPAQEVLLLYRARWQVELLFKLWKSHGQVDQWSSANPQQILCEFYAKLLAMLVQHWVLMESCWDDPHRSWMLSADLLRDQVSLFLQGLRGRLPLEQVLQLIHEALAASASIPQRTTRPSTSHQLLDGEYWGLT